MTDPAHPPVLPVEGILRLQDAGLRLRHAGSSVERALATDHALALARRYRDAGASWRQLAYALGVTESTLRRWRTATRAPKFHDAVPPATAPIPTRPDAEATSPAPGLDAQRQSPTITSGSQDLLSQHHLSSSTSSTLSSLNLIADQVTARAGPTRPVRRNILILTGDPRPGGNHFDHEVATIRRRLHATTIAHRHVASVELGEIAELIDRQRPAILHVAAHRSLGGIALNLSGRALLVDPHEVAAAVERARTQPRGAVLNFCSSNEIARRLARSIPATIAWPGVIDDEQSVCFSDELYRHVASGARVRRCFDEATTSARARWPDLEPPILHGRWPDPLL